MEDAQLLAARTWRWLRVRILGLLAVESRLHAALFPPETPRELTGGEPWR